MLRPRLFEEPTSRFAIWSRRLAVFSIPVLLLAIVVVRSGILDIVPALATFAGALCLALAAILLALVAFVVIWIEGPKGLGHAVFGLMVGVAILAYPAYLGLKAYRLPAIYDITTDPIDPPRFETIARVRSRDANPLAYAGLRAAELQRGAYPNIEPLVVSAPPQAAYEAARAVINRRKWLVVDERPPQAGRRDGLIEAVARTPIMGFRDDVAVRIRPDQQGARIDVRSASRYGHHDFGTNAARVRRLLDDIDDAVGTEEELLKKQSQKAAKPEQAPKKLHAPAKR